MYLKTSIDYFANQKNQHHMATLRFNWSKSLVLEGKSSHKNINFLEVGGCASPIHSPPGDWLTPDNCKSLKNTGIAQSGCPRRLSESWNPTRQWGLPKMMFIESKWLTIREIKEVAEKRDQGRPEGIPFRRISQLQKSHNFYSFSFKKFRKLKHQ